MGRKIKNNILHLFLFCVVSIIVVMDIIYIIKNSYKFLSQPKFENIVIEVEASSLENGRGPQSLMNSIYEVLPYSSGRCKVIASEKISPTHFNEEADYHLIIYPRFNESVYEEWVKTKKVDKLLLGPVFVPNVWFQFPNSNVWKEKRFPEILKSVKKVVVHTDRVKNYLAKRTNTTDIIDKFQNVRACTNLRVDNVKSFEERDIDIIFFEKYADTDRSKQGEKLFELLNKTSKKIVRMKYGSYKKEDMIEYAKNSKFIIYYSFYDTGAIGLKEIQNYGVIAFSHQKEFILDETTDFYVPELDAKINMYNVTTGFYVPELEDAEKVKPAFDIIMEKIEMISKKKDVHTELIAEINYENNRCEKALDDLCVGLLS